MSPHLFQNNASKPMSNKYNRSAFVKWSRFKVRLDPVPYKPFTVRPVLVPSILVADTIYCTMWESLWKEILKPKYRLLPAIGTSGSMIGTLKSRSNVLTPGRSPRTARAVELENANYASINTENNPNSLPAPSSTRRFIDWYNTYMVIWIVTEVAQLAISPRGD